MSARAFWADVAECRRLLRHYRQVRDDNKNSEPAPRVGCLTFVLLSPMGIGLSPTRHLVNRVLLWAVIPLLAFPWWHFQGFPFWFGPLFGSLQLGLFLSVALISQAGNTPRKLTTFEALHMPSRRSLFVARLVPQLPWWLWVGFWGTAGLLMANWGAVQDGEKAVLYLLIGAQVPCFVLGLLGAMTLVWRIWGRAWSGGAVPMWFVYILSVSVFPFMLINLIDFFHQIGFKPAQAFASHLDLIAPTMLLVVVGLLALQVWALDRLEPMIQINPLMGSPQDPQLAQHKARKTRAHGRRVVRGKLGPAPLLAGRHGLGWAAAYYACFKLWAGGLRGLLSQIFQSGLIIYLFFNQLYAILAGGKRGDWMWMAPLIFWSTAIGPNLQGSNPQRLYLLGVNYRFQLVHRLRTFWITPAALLVSIGALLAWVFWDKAEIALALLALWAGITLLCEGWFGWPVLLRGGIGCLSLLAAFVLWVMLVATVDPALRSTAMRVQLFAAALGAFGLAGILYKWWKFDEDRLADVVAAAQGPVVMAKAAHRPG